MLSVSMASVSSWSCWLWFWRIFFGASVVLIDADEVVGVFDRL